MVLKNKTSTNIEIQILIKIFYLNQIDCFNMDYQTIFLNVVKRKFKLS